MANDHIRAQRKAMQEQVVCRCNHITISFVCSAYPGILVPLQVHAENAEQKRPLLSWEARFVRTMVSIHLPSFPARCAMPTGLHFVSASLLS